MQTVSKQKTQHCTCRFLDSAARYKQMLAIKTNHLSSKRVVVFLRIDNVKFMWTCDK